MARTSPSRREAHERGACGVEDDYRDVFGVVPITAEARTQRANLAERAKRRARNRRHHLNDAERTLWGALRNRQLGVEFRRQVALEEWVADFLCAERRLVVMIDEEGDAGTAEIPGYRVLRFSESQVRQELRATLETILNALKRSPNPKGERETLPDSPKGES